MVFGGRGKSLREGEKLIEARGAWSDERCRVQDDVVGNAEVVSVGDESTVRAIVRQSWTKVEADEAEIVPSFASGVVNDDEGTARGDRVRGEVVRLAENTMVGRDGGLVVVGAHEIKSEFGLWKELGPVVDRKRWVSAG